MSVPPVFRRRPGGLGALLWFPEFCANPRRKKKKTFPRNPKKFLVKVLLSKGFWIGGQMLDATVVDLPKSSYSPLSRKSPAGLQFQTTIFLKVMIADKKNKLFLQPPAP